MAHERMFSIANQGENAEYTVNALYIGAIKLTQDGPAETPWHVTVVSLEAFFAWHQFFAAGADARVYVALWVQRAEDAR